ncbi:MAG: DUF3179 domain-containing protein [Gemmatimonadota bacterium]
MSRILLVCLLLIAAVPACAQEPGASAERLAGDEAWRTDFTRHSVPLDEIVSGGPPKDGIPAIDTPRFETVGEAAGWLARTDPMMIVEHGGVAKGYPLSILVWHEIVNDDVGGLPVAVTFCPLCNTALVFDRRLDGRLFDFGTTGRLRHSDLVMYDRQTESWWQQVTGEAIVGELVGQELQRVSSTTLAWNTARDLYPDLLVLSQDTGHDRPYGRTPYAGYDDPGNRPLLGFFNRDADPRLPAMERVVAVELGDGWSVPFRSLAEVRVVNEEVEGTPLAVFWSPGAASALDEAEIARGRDVGQTAVFDRRVGDRVLTFRPVDGGFRDRDTGSGWTLAGRAVDGPLAGERLEPIPHGNHFWFAWAVFRPDTRMWER